MKRTVYAILIIIAVLLGCAGEKVPEAGTWRISQCSPRGSFLEKVDEITFQAGCISFYRDSAIRSLPVLISNDRLVIKTEAEKMLFDIDKTSDTVWVLKELYNTNPVTITMSKINTSKKKLNYEKNFTDRNPVFCRSFCKGTAGIVRCWELRGQCGSCG